MMTSEWKRASRAAAWAVVIAAAMTAVAPPAGAQQQTAQPSSAQAAAPKLAEANEYRLGAGDVIRINVYQNPDLTLETRITEAGIVSFPLLGTVRIGGLTVTAAEKLIADGLRSGNFVKQPQVTIVVMQVRGNQVDVLGQVNRPGRYALEVAGMRLSDAIALAGGIAATGADVAVVKGSRRGAPYRTEIDVPSIFSAAGEGQDILIENGDVVWIDRQPVVYIYGEVQRPGWFRLERDMTLMQALAAGGGLTQRGTERGIQVHRKGNDGAVRILQPGLDDKVQNGDVVYVKESLF